MAAGEEKLRLVLAAIDKTAAPIRAVNRRIESMLAPIRKVRNAMRSLAQEAGLPRLGRALASVGKLVRNMAVAGTAAAVGFLEFTRRTAEQADSLAKLTRQIGFGIEAFQEYEFAAEISGVSTAEFGKATEKLAKNVGDLKGGTGSLKTLLDKVAPSLAIQLKGATDTGEALEIMLSALRRIEDPMKRSALASAAFGRSGLKLGLLARVSAEEIDGLRQEARRLGFVFSGETTTAAEAMNDRLTELKRTILGLARTLAGDLFPIITENAAALRDWIAAHRVEIINGARTAIVELGHGLRDAGLFMQENIPKIRATVEGLGGLQTVLKGIAALALAPVVRVMIALATAIGAVGSAVLGTGAALAYLLIQLEKATGIKGAILDVIDPLDPNSSLRSGLRSLTGGATSSPVVAAPRMAAGAALQAQAAVAAARLDGALSVDINLDDRRARVAKIVSSNPMVQFGQLELGRALATE